MKLFTMESDQDTLTAEIEAIQAEKEAAISALLTAKEDLVKAKDAIFYTIGAETYAQYSAGSNECELMDYFLQIKDIEEQVLATEAQMAVLTQTYDEEIAALEAKSSAPVTPAVEAPIVPVVEPAEPIVETPVVEPVEPTVVILPVAPILEEPVKEAPPVAPPHSMATNSFCENCGEKLSQGDIFCQFCGARITNK